MQCCKRVQELGRVCVCVCAPVNTQVINETGEVTRLCVTPDDVSCWMKEQKHHLGTGTPPFSVITTNKHRILSSACTKDYFLLDYS